MSPTTIKRVTQTTLFTDRQLDVVRFCAVECEMQMSGEASVDDMVRAWQWAMRAMGHGRPTEEDIRTLGHLVEPVKNAKGYRQVGVRVGHDIKMAHELVPSAMESLVGASALSAADWFYEYENVHPFRDGNGRTGQILFNWLNGTLRKAPVWAPNFWHDPRRVEGRGA